jgi:GTP-binding protein
MSLAYALFNLQGRGRLFIGPGEGVYEGMIIGIHSRGNDLVVNSMKAKQLTNIHAAGSDENILLTSPTRFDLEQAIEFIDDDELVEGDSEIDPPAQETLEGARARARGAGGERCLRCPRRPGAPADNHA